MSLNATYNPTPGCHCEPCEAKRSRKRVLSKLRKMGVGPGTVSSEEKQEASERLLELYGAGMSTQVMWDRAGLSTRLIGQIRENALTRMGRPTYDKIMRLDATLTAADFPGKHGGPLTDPTAATRMIQALAARGFTMRWMAVQMGCASSWVFNVAKGSHEYIARKNNAKVKALYRTYAGADPAECGVDVRGITRVMNLAQERSWAPPACWDGDSIGDPAAFAQWTGHCGTMKGYNIHRRDSIPFCNPCREAEKERRGSTTEVDTDPDDPGFHQGDGVRSHDDEQLLLQG